MGPCLARFLAAVPLLLTFGCAEGAPGQAREKPMPRAFAPCELLTAEEVATVLPGHGGGVAAPRRGASLHGIEAYQCSYTEPAPGLYTFEVILNVAVDDERFEGLRPSSRAMENARKLDIADAAWLRENGGALMLTVLTDRTRIDLDLMVTDAEGEADALVELALAIAARIE